MKLTAVDRNIVRTAVPSIIGAVVTWVTKASAHLTPTELAVVFPVATTAYYTVIRTLETKYPNLGWLLGALPQPKAVAPTAPVAPAASGSASGTVTPPSA